MGNKRSNNKYTKTSGTRGPNNTNNGPGIINDGPNNRYTANNGSGGPQQ